METLTMSREERDRLAILVEIQQGELTLRGAPQVSGLKDVSYSVARRKLAGRLANVFGEGL